MWLEKPTKTASRKKGKYRVCWRDAQGRRKSRVAFTDKRASMQLMAEMELKAARKEVGLVDVHAEARSLPMEQHLEDWIAALTESAKSEGYTGPARRRIERLMESQGWKRLDDITGDSFVRWRRSAVSEVHHQRKDRRNVPVLPLSNRTKNHFYDALKAFSNWCVKKKRMPAMWSPLAGVEKLPQNGHEKRKRRAFTEDEQARFLAVVPERHRSVILLAFGTGLRRNELRRLRWADVHLDTVPAFVQPPAVVQKGRRDDQIPLRSDLAELLRRLRAAEEHEPEDRVFRTMPANDRINGWIKKAGIPKVDASGRRVDFHAMRHTFNTHMLKAGVPLPHAQKLMRHTDPKLTANAYADAGQFPLAEGVEKLPQLALQWGNKGANLPPQPDSSGFSRTQPENEQQRKGLNFLSESAILAGLLRIPERAGDGSRTHNS